MTTLQNKSPQTNSNHFYTITPSALVFELADKPTALLILHYLLIRKGVKTGWKFRIADIQNMLRQNRITVKKTITTYDRKTITKYLRPLVELGLIHLTGEIGRQYYAFNDAIYKKYLKINPFGSDGSPQSVVGDPPQSLGRLDSTEKHITETDTTESTKVGVVGQLPPPPSLINSSAGSAPPFRVSSGTCTPNKKLFGMLYKQAKARLVKCGWSPDSAFYRDKINDLKKECGVL